MLPERRVRLSKFLSLILRHRPDQVGLALDLLGRVPLDALVEALRANGWEDLSPGEIEEVARLDGRRFDLADGMIRARYGHSLTVEQPGTPARPPEWLYVAVADAEIGDVAAGGLRPGQRQHVHLCQTPQEAARILERHQTRGQVITIFARRTHDRGVPFYQATDRLYLVSQVPPEFLVLPAPSPVGGRR
ncbi:MAG: RNA 2'-phosphotransferase [Armatimonadetes bacterium]|nr:RNA 2'-phosphotransferase [Armatimonadota bacterium]